MGVTSGVIGLDAILKHPLLSNGFFTLSFEGGGGINSESNSGIDSLYLYAGVNLRF